MPFPAAAAFHASCTRGISSPLIENEVDPSTAAIANQPARHRRVGFGRLIIARNWLESSAVTLAIVRSWGSGRGSHAVGAPLALACDGGG